MLRAYTEPDLLIYTDGQVLIRKGLWYVEASAPPSEMCLLLRQIQNALDYSGPTYNETPLPEFGFGNGEPFIGLRISANPLRSGSISIFEPPYMTASALRPFTLAQQYMEAKDYGPYSSQALLLWVEEVQRFPSRPDIPFLVLDWPTAGYGFPELIERLGVVPSGPVVVDSSIDRLPEEAIEGPTITLFEEDDRSFVMMTRPLLPHESLESINSLSFRVPDPVPIDDLPFQCSP